MNFFSSGVFSLFMALLLFSLFLFQSEAQTTFPGVAYVGSVSSNVGSTFCGKWSLVNSKTVTMRSFLFTVKSCNGQITSFWSTSGNITGSKMYNTYSNPTEVWMFQGENYYIPANSKYTDIGFCISHGSSWNMNQSLVYAVEFSTSADLNCAGMECAPKCGDGFCAVCETATSCPVDCMLNQCLINTSVVLYPKILGTPSFTIVGSAPTVASPYATYNLFVKNTGSTTVVFTVLTFKICSAYASISSFWGYTSKLISYTGKVATYRAVCNSLFLAPLNTFNTGTVSMALVLPGFDQTKHMKMGVELYSTNPGYTVDTAVVTCGDGACGTGENATNCPIDCATPIESICP